MADEVILDAESEKGLVAKITEGMRGLLKPPEKQPDATPPVTPPAPVDYQKENQELRDKIKLLEAKPEPKKELKLEETKKPEPAKDDVKGLQAQIDELKNRQPAPPPPVAQVNTPVRADAPGEVEEAVDEVVNNPHPGFAQIYEYMFNKNKK